ncbi:glycoside hydrolase family protein [Cellulosilyticum ruminicola]|uniref:right-handed parallel beta-helix repeat-containing protein n=1 Tax=Cellulosilyticum ruminicola TaxID=425254 RepID=UPI0006D1128E|nr:right-handed parallel beta-helix repeat-containing protein [Cellulosilyticum ruminicola]
MSILNNYRLIWMCLIVALMSNLCLGSTIDKLVQEIAVVQKISGECIEGDAIFVSLEGDDIQGDGSIEKPYASFKKALSNISPGQTLYIRGGVYTEAITLRKSGKENEYIKICNYLGEEVILDYSECNKEIMINLGGQSYIHIEGLELRNNVNKWTYGFYLGNGENHIIIKDNKIHDLYATRPTSSNSGANGIICYGSRADKSINNVLIEGNEVYDCNTGWCEAITVAGNCEYISVINNNVRNTGNIGIDFAGNFGYCSIPELDKPRYCEAIGNVISDENSPNAISYGLYVDGGRDILFDRNIIYNCAGGIEVGAEEPSEYPTRNIIIRNNLIYNNIENGLTVGGYYIGGGKVENVKIYNNTVVNNGEENGELVISIVNGLQVANNIFYTNQYKPLINSRFESSYTKNISFSHNLYYSGYSEEKAKFEMQGECIGSVENWRESYEPSVSYGKPEFENMRTDNYTLVKESLGVNSGDNDIEAGELDLNHAMRYQEIIDCGAYEYNEEDKNQGEEIILGEEKDQSEEKIPVEEDKAQNEEDNQEKENNESEEVDQIQDSNLLPSFSKEVWHIVNNATQLEIQDDRSMRIITPKAWKGISLWGVTGLPQNKVLEIGYDLLGERNSVQVWADGSCLVELKSVQSSTKTFIIPEGTETVDICIAASKKNTAIIVNGLYVKQVE